MDLAIYALLISAKEVIGEMYLRDFQCWESQIFFLLRKAQIRNENWIRLLRIRKCKAFAPQ